ncbi:MAG TPA: hypothetical protein VGM84_09280 [Steroidobacteraceae bacterium]|jgi:hypothetical protein
MKIPEHGELASVVAALCAASATEDGRRTVAAHDEQYELGVGGDDGLLILEMRQGQMIVLPVSERAPEFCRYTRVDFLGTAISDIASQSLTPTEAVEEGRILLRSRLYGGGQFLRLLRLSQRESTSLSR